MNYIGQVNGETIMKYMKVLDGVHAHTAIPNPHIEIPLAISSAKQIPLTMMQI